MPGIICNNLLCRSTSELEGFYQHILMYCAKRFAYSPLVYRARNLLAGLDHNNNSEREIKRNKDGKSGELVNVNPFVYTLVVR